MQNRTRTLSNASFERQFLYFLPSISNPRCCQSARGAGICTLYPAVCSRNRPLLYQRKCDKDRMLCFCCFLPCKHGDEFLFDQQKGKVHHDSYVRGFINLFSTRGPWHLKVYCNNRQLAFGGDLRHETDSKRKHCGNLRIWE